MHTHTHTHTHSPSRCVDEYIKDCVFMYLYACLYVSMRACFVCVCVCVYPCVIVIVCVGVRAWVFLCIYMCVCVCVHKHACIFVYARVCVSTWCVDFSWQSERRYCWCWQSIQLSLAHSDHIWQHRFQSSLNLMQASVLIWWCQLPSLFDDVMFCPY